MSCEVSLTIYRGHPSSAGAFAEAMTLGCAHGFLSRGATVTILSGGSRSAERPGFLSEVARICPEARVAYVYDGPSSSLSTEWIVWNSYRKDDQPLLRQVRKAGVRVTKSFPRLLGRSKPEDEAVLRSRGTQFDLVAFALRVDEERANLLAVDGVRHAYVPRGFMGDFLVGAKNPNVPVVAIDAPVKPKSASGDWSAAIAMTNVVKALDEVRALIPEVRIVGTRSNSYGPKWTNVPRSELTCYYASLLAPAWVYVSAPLASSRQGEGAPVAGGLMGLYENQVVEAQISGAVVVAPPLTVAAELIGPGSVGLTNIDYTSVPALREAILEAIRRFRAGDGVRNSVWARASHSTEFMAQAWLEAMSHVSPSEKPRG